MDNCQWNSFTVWAKYVSLVPPFINRMVEIVLVAYLHDCDRFVCDVENKLNVSNHTISKWELGINTPSVEDMQKLAQVFGVTITELVVDKPVIKDFLELLSLGENMPENELPKLVEEAYEQVLRARHLKPSSEGKQAYLLAMLAYHLYCFRSASESIRERMSQNGWTKEKVQAEIEKQKQFTAESIERNLLSYEPSWLEECYKAVDIKSFAAQFWGRYNFARENTAMRNEYDFSSAKRNPYTT